MKKNPIQFFIESMKSRKFWLYLTFLITLNLISAFFSLIPAYLTQLLFDEIIDDFKISSLFIIMLLLLTFFLIYGLISIFNTYFYIKQLNVTSIHFRIKFLSAYLSKNYEDLADYSEGDILYRGNTDIQHICELSYELIIKTVTQLVFLIGILILLFKTNYLLSICVLFLMFTEYIFNFACSNSLKNKLIRVKESDAHLLEIYKQIINRYIYIRLNRLQSQESKRFTQIIKEVLDNRKVYTLSQSYLSGITNLISGIRQMFVLAIGAYLISQGSLTIGLLIAFNQLVSALVQPMNFFSNWIHFYKDLHSSFDRIADIMETSEPSNYISPIDSYISLKCENVYFGFNKDTLIKNINFTIYKGEKIAIIGESGSGKSTFCKLIAGLYNYKGKISLDEKVTREKFKICFMLDESAIFRGTLWENITYGLDEQQFNEYQVKDVLHKVNLEYLWENSKISSILIDKNTLSKGEKQRLELARIILIKPDLIILDEPTSGLDETTEKIVWENFREECKNSTLLYTTHKKNIIRSNDRVFEMKDGNLYDSKLNR